jgi:putative selenate reductase molybdopterin-binding subunit
MMVPTKAVENAATALRDKIIDYASRASGEKPAHCRIEDGHVHCARRKIPLTELVERAAKEGVEFATFRKAYGSPRTVAFIAYGVRIAVHRITGEIVVLYNIEAVDAGVVMNPHQLRGQVVGGVVMGIGYTLQEKMVYNDAGAVINPTLRNYRIPALADAPETEVFFAETHDKIGPLGAKSIAENTNCPVPPAIANALRNATGARFTSLPLTEDRIFEALTAD